MENEEKIITFQSKKMVCISTPLAQTYVFVDRIITKTVGSSKLVSLYLKDSGNKFFPYKYLGTVYISISGWKEYKPRPQIASGWITDFYLV